MKVIGVGLMVAGSWANRCSIEERVLLTFASKSSNSFRRRRTISKKSSVALPMPPCALVEVGTWRLCWLFAKEGEEFVSDISLTACCPS